MCLVQGQVCSNCACGDNSDTLTAESSSAADHPGLAGRVEAIPVLARGHGCFSDPLLLLQSLVSGTRYPLPGTHLIHFSGGVLNGLPNVSCTLSIAFRPEIVCLREEHMMCIFSVVSLPTTVGPTNNKPHESISSLIPDLFCLLFFFFLFNSNFFKLGLL